MDQNNEIGYYHRREAAARELAAAARDQQIRRIHIELAEQYAAKALELSVQSPATAISGR